MQPNTLTGREYQVKFMLRISEKIHVGSRTGSGIRKNHSGSATLSGSGWNLPMSLETSREYKGNFYVKNNRKNSCRIRNRTRIQNTVRIRIPTHEQRETSSRSITFTWTSDFLNKSALFTIHVGSGSVQNHSGSTTQCPDPDETYPWAWRRAPAASPSPRTSLWGPPASWTASPQIPV